MRRLAWLLLLCLGLAAGAADPKAAALARDADRAYRAQQYAEAARLLQQAYELEPVPLYLYNIARAREQAGEVTAALEAYERFVALPAAEALPELKKKATLAMERLRAPQEKPAAPPPPAAPSRPVEDPQEAERRADAEAAEARRQRRELEAQKKSRRAAEAQALQGRTLATWVAGGVGVAALGTSLGCALAANGSRSAFRAATTLADKRRLEAETRGLAAATDVALVVGLAAAVTAGVLWPGTLTPTGAVGVAVAPVAGGAVASLGGTF